MVRNKLLAATFGSVAALVLSACGSDGQAGDVAGERGVEVNRTVLEELQAVEGGFCAQLEAAVDVFSATEVNDLESLADARDVVGLLREEAPFGLESALESYYEFFEDYLPLYESVGGRKQVTEEEAVELVAQLAAIVEEHQVEEAGVELSVYAEQECGLDIQG
ncbi:hypothetical protein [Phytoactinopolyspora limicola]|uniref:hypothetical protein n=1 Tax=Phytoactinopolyspora limicola TaxID=2715536 RepID=UPI00140B51D6|nr:hypothetical protein [Phytoactinopolyspora limicola]